MPIIDNIIVKIGTPKIIDIKILIDIGWFLILFPIVRYPNGK